MNTIKKILFCIALCSIILLPQLFTPCAAAKDNSQPDTVRIGYYIMPDYQEYDNDNYSGYAYDYMQEIAQYANWEYSFVRSDFTTCLKLLREKRIDLICGLTPDADTKHAFLFSDATVGTSQTELFTRTDNDVLNYNDYSNFHNLTIGVLKDFGQIPKLKQSAKKNNYTYTLKTYRTQEQLEQALESKEIDAIFASNVSKSSLGKSIAKISKMDLHFASYKKSPYIQQLDDAVMEINDTNPYFEDELSAKYSTSSISRQTEFTKKEKEYIKNAKEITVVYDPLWKPIEYYNKSTKTYDGITSDILSLISKNTGLKFRYVRASNFTDSLSMLARGDAQMLSAISHDYNWGKKHDLYLSAAYLPTSVARITSNHASLPKDTKNLTVALPKNYYTSQQIAQTIHKDHITYYDSIEQCLDAVQSNKADATYVNTIVANYYLSESSYANLSVIQLSDIEENLSIGISKKCDPILLRIINKGIMSISDDSIDAIVLEKGISRDSFSFKNLIYTHPIYVINGIVIAFIILLLFIFIIATIRHKKTIIIKRLADIDHLSGLYNRRAREHKITAILKHSTDSVFHCLMIIDLDYFKNVNDTYGHKEGDQLIVAVSKTLKYSARDTDVVGRMGGDEFVIFLNQIRDKKDGLKRAEEVNNSLRILATSKKEWNNVTASIGVCVCKGNVNDIEDLYSRADTALYCAKENGRNQCQLYEEPDTQEQMSLLHH